MPRLIFVLCKAGIFSSDQPGVHSDSEKRIELVARKFLVCQRRFVNEEERRKDFGHLISNGQVRVGPDAIHRNGRFPLFSIRSGQTMELFAKYQNEAEVGEALAEAIQTGIVKREDLFITTKLWNSDHGHVLEACEDSLKKLHLEYLDLYLVHFPIASKFTGIGKTSSVKDENGDLDIDTTISLETTWHAMEGLVSMGLVRSIGGHCFNLMANAIPILFGCYSLGLAASVGSIILVGGEITKRIAFPQAWRHLFQFMHAHMIKQKKFEDKSGFYFGNKVYYTMSITHFYVRGLAVPFFGS
ncbi:hypothetical protein IFM89_027592 [Coptis chinensis]|uniref:NADP-dependent oxidoreductase domain-containing protein n=1 Tax=Coptis chinensis TaxID=261450 RepID=A0A835IRP0_9MAGN|nr:hypothetical protein IFM89_027592 [Coptis chinensis]